MNNLEGKKVAILTEDGFEELELTSPKQVLEDAGAKVDIVSPQTENVTGWSEGNWSDELAVDVVVSEAKSDDYDALMIPGGVLNPDKMRRNQYCIDFAKAFMEDNKPIASICHGPQLLIETGMLKGKNLTSFNSIKTDLLNAGANWQNKEVVTDQGLVTSRSPEDLQAFNNKMIEEFNEGIHKYR